MKIIIEIKGGTVAGIYHHGLVPASRELRVFVVDLDGEQVGEPTQAQEWELGPLKQASPITQELITKALEIRAESGQ